VTVLRQLIRFYGDSMQALVPSYLEFSMNNLSQEQQKLRDQMASAFGPTAFQAMEEQVRKNMTFFTEAMRMFSPFPQTLAGITDGRKPEGEAGETGDLETLRRQMAEMQAKLDKLASK
jgi:polyhydroxyalkanoate synthesis regulator protein